MNLSHISYNLLSFCTFILINNRNKIHHIIFLMILMVFSVIQNKIMDTTCQYKIFISKEDFFMFYKVAYSMRTIFILDLFWYHFIFSNRLFLSSRTWKRLSTYSLPTILCMSTIYHNNIHFCSLSWNDRFCHTAVFTNSTVGFHWWEQ